MTSLLRIVVLCVGAVTVGAETVAQPEEARSGYSFDRLRIDKAGKLKFNVKTGTIESITGGADITLLGDDPNQKPLRLRAGTATFAPPSKEGEPPEKVSLKGNVIINHPEGVITSDQAEWNSKTSVIVFMGNPVLKSQRISEVRGSRMQLNLETGDFEVVEAEVPSLELGGLSSPAQPELDANLLQMPDIRDWPGFVAKVKAQGAAQSPSPGRHITDLLDAEARGEFARLPTEQQPDERAQSRVLKHLNSLLTRREFYNRDAWQGIPVGEEASALLKKGAALVESELIRRNRLLIEAAFPHEIAKRSAAPAEAES